MHSMKLSFRFAAGLVSSVAGFSSAVSAQTVSPEAGLIGKRYAGADFTYDHFNGTSVDHAIGGVAMINAPVAAAYDVGLSYAYADTSGPGAGAVDRALGATVLTHRLTEYGTAYFAGTVGNVWNRATSLGSVFTENGGFWTLRAGYEMPVGRRTAVNAGLGFTDAFSKSNVRAKAWRYQVELNHWFSGDLAGVATLGYKQLKSSPDAVSFTLGVRLAF